MYIDYVLFAVGGILLGIALLLLTWLLRSRRKSQEYRRVLQAETQRIDVISTLKETERLATEWLPAGPVTYPLETKQTEKLGEEISPGAVERNTLLLSGERRTALLEDRPPDNTELPLQKEIIGVGLDLTPLAGKYELLREIHGGGMSRIFLARHTTLGNEWVVKYVEGANTELANEAEVLKKLNHISLPQIIDIFQTQQGTFLVERYIEGYSLDRVLGLGEIKESLICDWALQLAQVLHYLHNLETPIIHCDLKPSNIMVTHDNRLVLIDFGISKRQGIDEKQMGITYRYAAPEQFKGSLARTEQAMQRFGILPPEHDLWAIDPRTDLYSVGVILYELVTGAVPIRGDLRALYQNTSAGLAGVIAKCLELDPAKRYHSAKELANALENVKGQQTSMVRSLTLRRVAAACCAVSLLAGAGTTASAAYINQQESLAIVDMDPGRVVVTAQQSAKLLLQKTMPNGEVITLEPSQFQWSYSEDNIARLDGDRLVGLNVGETTIYGQYRNKVISLTVAVTEPIEELVEVALRYPEGTEVSLYAGDGQREIIDGPLEECSFISPEDMSVDGDTLYIVDSGVIRIVENGEISSLYLEPDYLTASLVRGWKNDLYVLTGPWIDEDEVSYYGILRISDDGAEFLYYTEAAWSTISDMAFSSDGTLWFIQQNMGTGATTLNRLDMESLEAAWVMDLPDNARKMTFDKNDTLYMSAPEEGTIIRVGHSEEKWTYFAGVAGERNFIDGAIPNFYRPTSLAVKDNALYVLDFDTVRKITIEGEGALFTETLAGVPTADTNPEIQIGGGGQMVFPASELAILSADGNGELLLSVPKSSVIYQIKF